MAIERQRFVAGHLRTLYQLGAIGDLSDRQLLERFTASEGEPAELAFAALVERHGPMVLRVCSVLLRDPCGCPWERSRAGCTERATC